MNSSDSQVRVDLDQLTDWGNSINNLNDDADDILKAFSETIDDLDNYFKGNFASGFISDSTAFIKRARSCHNAMKDIPNIVKEIVNAKERA